MIKCEGDNMRNNYMTYDSDAALGYIYLTEPGEHEIDCTEELVENPDIILDVGKHFPIIGIELAGVAAEKLKYIADKDRIFSRKRSQDGREVYSFMLQEKKVVKAISFKEMNEVKFLFADEQFNDFIGLELDVDRYNF